jgi:hypothetical protein
VVDVEDLAGQVRLEGVGRRVSGGGHFVGESAVVDGCTT